jgi:hypothetical protein
MTNELKSIREEFTIRMDKLEAARLQLKKEFIGIDGSIDQLINNVRSWYTMSKMQDRPSIINLWGLTGVGKTSLLFRLMELINFKDFTYHFDMGEKSGSFAFREKFNELCSNDADEPIVIILDEFQFARTIKIGNGREEIEDDKSRMVWELIDSGKIIDIQWKNGLYHLGKYIGRLHHLIQSGLKAKNGKVTSQKHLFVKEILDEFLDGDEYLNKEYDVIPLNIRNTIISEVGTELGIILDTQLEEEIAKMNETEALEFVKKALILLKRPQVKKFTQALIFIVGNMDEAYLINQNYSADIEADEFHRLSLEVKLPNIKNALRTRFRDEQISRMGNIHIIYPALTCDSYEKIIRKELTRISDGIREKYGIDISFDNSVMKKIYQEGVYPTQGVRPVLTTIQQIIRSKLSVFFYQLIEKNLTVDSISVSESNNELVATYQNGSNEVYNYSIPIESTLEHLRKNTKDDKQAITAVHEAGHGVLSAALLNEYPEYLFSITSDLGASGFMYAKIERKYITKSDLTNRVAMYLGGVVAEELIFGSEYLTDGGDSDIKKAYQFVSTLLKNNGFSEEPLYFADQSQQNEDAYHHISEIEEKVKSIILKGKELAKKTLEREKKLLLLTASYLSENSRMGQDLFIQYVEKYASTKFQPVIPRNFYREKLSKQIESFAVLEDTMEKIPVLLNKTDSNHV